jgi:hypothetical protein
MAKTITADKLRTILFENSRPATFRDWWRGFRWRTLNHFDVAQSLNKFFEGASDVYVWDASPKYKVIGSVPLGPIKGGCPNCEAIRKLIDEYKRTGEVPDSALQIDPSDNVPCDGPGEFKCPIEGCVNEFIMAHIRNASQLGDDALGENEEPSNG